MFTTRVGRWTQEGAGGGRARSTQPVLMVCRVQAVEHVGNTQDKGSKAQHAMFETSWCTTLTVIHGRQWCAASVMPCIQGLAKSETQSIYWIPRSSQCHAHQPPPVLIFLQGHMRDSNLRRAGLCYKEQQCLQPVPTTQPQHKQSA